MSLLGSANAAARYALELCALAAFTYWGFKVANVLVLDIVLGLGAATAFMVVWAAFVDPRAPHRIDDPYRLLLEVIVFALAAMALALTELVILAVLLAIAVAGNLALMVLLGQRGQGGI